MSGKRTGLRIIAALMICFLLLPAAVGCGKQAKNERLTVVCTVFPLYDWARQICLSSDAELILLTDGGTDLHSYQPTAEDMIQIATCDLLIMVGGASDAWVEEALAAHPSEQRSVCRLSEVEDMTLRQISEESLLCEENCTDEHHDHDHGHETADEHLWLSLKNAKISCEEIARQLKKLDETNQETYQRNLEAYHAELDALDKAYAQAVSSQITPSVVFADRFPFVYLMEDYGVRYAAAFRGCTTDTDADFDTVLRLASRVDEWGLTYVLTTEKPTQGLAEQICANTKSKNQKILAMHSLQSVTRRQMEEGMTYLNVMEQNLEILKIVLTNQ